MSCYLLLTKRIMRSLRRSDFTIVGYVTDISEEIILSQVM